MLHFDVVEERMEAMQGVEHPHTSSILIRWDLTRLMNTCANLIFVLKGPRHYVRASEVQIT